LQASQSCERRPGTAFSPLLKGLSALVVMVGPDATAAARQLSEAGQIVTNAGFEAETRYLRGEPEVELPPMLKEAPASMLVMGAYGYSRIRQLIVGSTTTTLLHTVEVPVQVLR
jgi:nucleotide-binding universal stress UspA family protein